MKSIHGRFSALIATILVVLSLAACGGGGAGGGGGLSSLGQAVKADFTKPQNGVWWNPAESGRGFALEFQGETVSLGAYMYEADGRPVWYVGLLARQADNSYRGQIARYAGGQTLTGSYRPPTSSSTAATATLTLTSSTSGALRFETTAGQHTVAVQRFAFSGTTATASSGDVESGLWWNEAESGRGFFLDIQGNTAAMSTYMYDESGQPVWYLAVGTMANLTFTGALQSFQGGQTLGGNFRAAQSAGSPGNITFRGLTSSTAQLTLPGGRVIALKRLTFASRNWTAGQSLETGDVPVQRTVLETDEVGNAVALFTKTENDVVNLYAVRGLPRASGETPQWSSPVQINLLNGQTLSALSTGSLGLRVAPGGNAVAMWFTQAACTAQTYNTSGNCRYIYRSRFNLQTTTWSAPEMIASSPGSTGDLHLNDKGDFALLYTGWERVNNSVSQQLAVLWQAAGQSQPQQQLFAGETAELGMDKSGNLLLAGHVEQNLTTDIFAWRGNVSTGFGAREILEQRSSAAEFRQLAVGLNGNAAIYWTQNNGTTSTSYVATLATPSGAWTVTALEPYDGFNDNKLVVTDGGEALFYRFNYGNCYRYLWSAGAWSDKQALPSGTACPASSTASYPRSFNRLGDYVVVNTSFGEWGSYNAASNQMGTRYGSYVWGVQPPFGWFQNMSFSLSASGVAAMAVAADFDVLPTASQPSGDGRRNVTNLWGHFLR